MVHGDDFTILEYVPDLDWFREKISEKYDIKFRGRLGADKQDDKEIRLLNRVIYWEDKGMRYEPDQRHADIIIALSGSQDKKSVNTPGTKPSDTKDEENDDVLLEPSMATRYRAIVARGNYLPTQAGYKICHKGVM